MSMFFGHNQGESESLGYGYLYNRYAIIDANFPPTDWEVPSESDFDTLIASAGGSGSGGNALKEAGTNHWIAANGTNTTGFTGLGSGYRTFSGTFARITEYLNLWDTEGSSPNYMRIVGISGSIAYQGALAAQGNSIRLLYTGAGTPTTVTDNDGNVYDVVLIGSQRWTVQNWKCTTLSRSPFTALTKVTDSAAWAALTTEGYCAYDNDDNNV